jgi:uncharacterized protein YjiS (DUF1127 family)
MAALQTKSIVQMQHMAHVIPNSATERDSERVIRGLIEMAYTNSTPVLHADQASRAAGLLGALRTAISRRAVYGRTVRELSALSNRELADLGIDRTMITRVANEAAYGK